MKKLLVLLVLFLLVGCSNGKLEKIEVDRNQYSTIYEWEAIGISENGLYFIKDEILYYKDNNEDAVPLGSVNYVDGEKTQIFETFTSYKIRMDDFHGRDLICYGDRIYMVYITFNYDMSEYYQLASIDMKGEDFKTHLEFDYVPQRVVINNGKIYVMYSDEESNQDYIEIYNQNFKLEKTEYYDSKINALSFYIENDVLVIPDSNVIYENKNIKISNLVEIDSENNVKSTGIAQIGNEIFTFENKTILFINDNYFYAASDTYPQTYERYHLNGELDKAIVISEHIESDGTVYGATDMDFSYMLKLRDENIGYGYSNSENPKIFEVNFEKETCNYVNE